MRARGIHPQPGQDRGLGQLTRHRPCTKTGLTYYGALSGRRLSSSPKLVQDRSKGRGEQIRIADYSRRSLSARLGTTKDARKSGKNLLPVHRKAITSPSAASKV